MPKESKRYWLTFDARLAQQPVIWEMGRKHPVVFDIRSANVTAELGLVALELTGEPSAIVSAVNWLRRRGVQVDPA